MAVDELARVIHDLMEGAVLRSVGRAAGTGIVKLFGTEGELIIHIQCPFRMVRDGRILVGSADMNFSLESAGDDAFDNFDTLYDARVCDINEIVQKFNLEVSGVSLDGAGGLVLTWAEELFLEIFPNSSRETEAWRVFYLDGAHYGYPPHLI
ncbi:hypothetical protein [Kribbella ginsengisoli]|uniref:YbjN domain-containing protein n=1 Tax=Kribbella ginsengisoli TaxID=363865 RepID=A0ABP6YMR8_9ACTN